MWFSLKHAGFYSVALPLTWACLLVCLTQAGGHYTSALLLVALLFLPLLDPNWKVPRLRCSLLTMRWWSMPLMILSLAIIFEPNYLRYTITTILFTALPEEWFFRGYFLKRIGLGWRANWITSLLFALLHGITRSPLLGIAVLLPSLLFGWIYQKTNDLILAILVHTSANILYVAVLSDWFEPWFDTQR